MNRPNSQDLSSFLASLTAATSLTSSLVTTTSQVSSTLATIASVNTDGHTVYITKTETPSTLTSTSSSSTSTPTTTTAQPSGESSLNRQQSSSNGTPVGAIAGGVVGGVAVLAASLFLLFFLWRRKRVKEERRATVPPPPYQDGGDMSEQLGTTTTPRPGTKAVAASSDDSTPESVPQLDGTAINCPVEANSDALGNIPELPATAPTRRNSDPFITPDSSIGGESSGITANKKSEQPRTDSENHVMSWSLYNSMGSRDPSSRLSQPHATPDASTTVWENMSPTKTKLEEQ